MVPADCDLLILDEPTRGVDVGAKTEIYGLIHRWPRPARRCWSSPPSYEELFGLCDRILVMDEGGSAAR